MVVGGGPVGLALAVELGQRGVSCTLVEQRDRARMVPRAKLVNVRSMEHMRRWGIAEEIRDASPLPAEYSTDVAFVTSVLGDEITRFSNVFFTDTRRDDRFAEPAQQTPQYAVEPILRRRAEACESVMLLDGWRVESVVELDGSVRVEMHSDGVTRTIEAQYVVGCDGAGSTVREQLGIEMAGRHGIARNLGVVFRAPELGARLPHAPALHFWTVNPDTPSYMGPADRHGLWWLQATGLPNDVELEKLDPVAVVRGALGADVPMEIVSVDPWHAHALTAKQVRRGRVFLAGDAAHMHTPMGAHGMNQGIGDAVDLGWKLHATLAGWADPAILASYDAERAPLHERITAEATGNYHTIANYFVRAGIEEDSPRGRRMRRELAEEIQTHKAREFYSLGLILGHCYEGSPIVVPDGTPAPAPEVETFMPRARPGSRVPHAWLEDGSSLFDEFGRGYTLLRFADSRDGAIEAEAVRRGIELATLDVSDARVAALYPHPFALVRPDQVLAWHGDAPDPHQAARILDVVSGRVEASSPAAAAPDLEVAG